MSQLFEDGKVVNVDGVDLECVGVSYQETDGERHTFGYTFRPKTEVDAERKAEEERLAAEAESVRLDTEAAERTASEASTDTPVETTQPAVQPEVNKEETLDVK